MSKEQTTPRDRRGKELVAIVRQARATAGGRVITFEMVVAHRCLIVVRAADGQYRHTLTTDFDRCGERTREASIKAAVAEAKAHYDEKRFIFGKEDTYGELNLTRPVMRYVVVMENDTNPEVSEPFETEDEQDAAARRLRRENPDDVIMWAIVNQHGELEMEAYSAGFLEAEEDEQDEEAA